MALDKQVGDGALRQNAFRHGATFTLANDFQAGIVGEHFIELGDFVQFRLEVHFFGIEWRPGR